MSTIKGFSKLSRTDKIAWLAKHFLTSNPLDIAREFSSFMHTSAETQRLFDGISENTLTNFYMPYGVAPNFVINGRTYVVPMVIEESSVVAAAASGAKFWSERGGFHAEVVSTKKVGHVHFIWSGDSEKLFDFFGQVKATLIEGVEEMTANMQSRGGGLLDIELVDCTHLEADYYQLKGTFETCDAMGANFINSVLEAFAHILESEIAVYKGFSGRERQVEIVMSILSNYTPESLVRAWVECPVADLGAFDDSGLDAAKFARRFNTAVKIANVDPYRATTHNKGIFNGIDAVVLATGNDFRAIEACGHAYAARNGVYSSLTKASVKKGMFRFEIEIPLAVGTVGGLTRLHPLSKRSLEMLGNPSARELMKIMACVGLAQNFAAVKALVTSGIQKGHMKMHLTNILNHFNATEKEEEQALQYFADKTVSFSGVREYLGKVRG
ncbi:MAG TPA: hydroxymethylglutaryl-CoA reductase, degradative [Bacteroidetes bacterium]|jgi:hydroxymethylglutaryl-CoA reductase|nr:MAG: hydroxymethylglutaryl-CoA reductase [Sphingobacteriales bacterium BACL12 MAG-120813-bin55]HCK22840.1 hydroxymethylglutaryl-CoA reductase, degradative [Bacteroidota bacterium]